MQIKVKYTKHQGLFQEKIDEEGYVDLPSMGIPKFVTRLGAPTETDDINQGFVIGSRWVSVGSGDEFVCIDNTENTAIWKLTTVSESGGGVFEPPITTTEQAIWIAFSTSSSSAYNNGIQYTPLRKSNEDTIDFQFSSNIFGVTNVSFYYAMSVADSGSLMLQFDSLSIDYGFEPDIDFTVGTPLQLTPGEVTALNIISQFENPDLAFSTSLGGIVRCKLHRLSNDIGDTHPGDLRIIEIRVLKAQ